MRFQDRLFVASGRRDWIPQHLLELRPRRLETDRGQAGASVCDVAHASREIQRYAAGRSLCVDDAEHPVVDAVAIEVDRLHADWPRQVHDREPLRPDTDVGEVLIRVEHDAVGRGPQPDNADQRRRAGILDIDELQRAVLTVRDDGEVEDLGDRVDGPVAIDVDL